MSPVARFSRFFLFTAALAATTMLTAGCGLGGSSGSGSRIRFVNASTNEMAVNVLIDGVSVASSLQNIGGATAYLAVSSGARHIQIQDPTSLQFLIDTTPTISGDTTYIIRDVAINGALPPPVILSDTNTAPTTGDFSIRVINLAPDLNSGVDAYVVLSSTSTLTGLTPNFAALPYPPSTATYSQIPVGTGSWEVVFTKAGQKAPIYGVSSALALVGGQIDTVLLVEDAGSAITVVPLIDVQ